MLCTLTACCSSLVSVYCCIVMMPVGAHCTTLRLPVFIVIIALFKVCCLAPSLHACGSSCPHTQCFTFPYCVGNFKERLNNIPYHSALMEKEVVFLMHLIPHELYAVSDKRCRATPVTAPSNAVLSVCIFTLSNRAVQK